MTSEVHVSLADNIIPKLRPVFKDKEHTHLILTSGRAGTKSSFAAIRIILDIIADDNCSIVVVRKFHNKLKKTVYKEILRAITRLKLPKDDFKITVSPMEIKYKPNGNTIYFTGNDSIDDTKGMIDESRPIKYVVIDELTEFFDKGDGEDELLNIEATFSRGNDDVFQILYLFNPPKNPNAPIMAWLAKMILRPDVSHTHTDYRDVPIKWLGKKLLESAMQLKESDEKLFNWIWLGICTGIDELIYYMFDRDKHVKQPGGYYDYLGIAIDYGQQNATTYQGFGLSTVRRCVEGVGEYYHSGRETGKQKSPSDYAADFISFVLEIEQKTGSKVLYVFIDPSAQGLAEEIKKIMPGIRIKNAQNAVQLGIDRVKICLDYGVLSISQEQENLRKEFGLYSFEKKSIERGQEVPLKLNDHCLDCLRYLIMGFWKQIRRFLPAGVEKSDVDIEPD